MAEEFWDELFATRENKGDGVPVVFRCVRKGGRPFLLLPAASKGFSAALSLYPAQTAKARIARKALGLLSNIGLAPGTENITVKISTKDELVNFLSLSAGVSKQELPGLGILAGNAATEGQRFLVLVIGRDGKPAGVIKIGLTASARKLIEKESSFLADVREGVSGLPRLRATFQCPRASALVLDYYPGESPSPGETQAASEILTGWVAAKDQIPLAQLPATNDLDRACANNPIFKKIAPPLKALTVAKTLYHGDFAAWNIRVSPMGVWTVLDWERGALAGMPGWDWFHFVLQPRILVERLSCAMLCDAAENLLTSTEFQNYAQTAGIRGVEREMMLAYLLNCTEVIRPAEGRSETSELLNALAQRWLI